ncbi:MULTISPECIES: hypothetical protein [unclassified Rhizobacter]|uniref:hypothetical protein n=1 Tax=unclassified Rhizobacter TaxID=2640088 RepID=UPI000ABAF76B|nr:MULTISPECIES: hypothetical protein [unclassified Rhizobacter]
MPMHPLASTDVPFARLADGELVTAGRRASKGLILCAGLLAWRRHPVMGLALGDLLRRTAGIGPRLARLSALGPVPLRLRLIPGRTDV